MESTEAPKKTPLYDIHRQSGGRVVEFAGFLMPVQFSGVVDEHRTVRAAVGLFDVSHMGQVMLTGPGAVAAAQRLVTNNVEALQDGKALYTPICYPDGGIVDDCLVYRLSAERVLFVVNAANIQKDHAWIAEQTGDRCTVEDLSDEHALLALQGPRACEIFAGLASAPVADLPPFSFVETTAAGVACLASRTGYTGEDGFEISCAPADAPALWTALMEAGAAHGIKPCGLGARDTLRLEARLPLYGNDIDAETTPLEAGLKWTVKFKAGDFIGRDALRAQRKQGLERRLVCMVMRSRGIARQGHTIHLPNDDGTPGERVGQVTSGTKSPTLGQAIALGYVSRDCAGAGTGLVVEVRGKPVQAEVIKGPFYKRSY
jgi:aminomethyltransferase